MQTVFPILIQLLGGLGGGSAIASILKKLSLGPLGNTLAGLVGGLAGGQLASLLNLASGSTDIVSLLVNLVGGGVGGAVLTLLAGLLKNMLSKK